MSVVQGNIDFKNENFDFFETYYKKTECEKIKLCIDFIAEKLNDRSMSAIVGAGFSLNSNQSFPDWATLLIDAYKKIHPKETQKENDESDDDYNKRIASEIRQIGEPVVAADYEEYMGRRESLDLYIEKRIFEKQKLPQNLKTHERFLELDWCDVITTNWDNLLEKADEKGNYIVVRSAKELKYSNKKRIVKIHGSLRSDEDQKNRKYEYDDCYDHLYLITKKDYENYPINHEGFSNFMKVKILENSFCLFGFSGNDWNFRYWVKELKRMMTKGGGTSSLNPIFLFDVFQGLYESDQEQFFRNNYIIPLKISDVFSYLGGNESPESRKNISEKFAYIFDYFLQKQKENKIADFGKANTSDVTVLRKLAFESKVHDFNDLMNSYIKLPKFDISNLYFTTDIARVIQDRSNDVKSWAEIDYLFIHTWCLNNFFSLSQLFRSEKIDEIINHFVESKFYQTNAVVFSELILGYYYETVKKDDFGKLISLISERNKDIAECQKCKYYFKQLEYDKLREVLENWLPENEQNVNPLHILCKITCLNCINKIYDSKNGCDISKLLEIAMNKCGTEYRLSAFVLLYMKFNKKYEFDQRINEMVSGIQFWNSYEPKRYIELLIKDDFDKNTPLSTPNAQKRYQKTRSFSSNNYENIKYRSLLNFFEYLSLPIEGIFNRNEFARLIRNVDEPSLFRLFPYVFCYFGNSSDESEIQSFVPIFLRRFPDDTKKFLFKKYLELFKYKIDADENPKTLCFLMNEFSKRVEFEEIKKYHDLFFKLFFEDDNKCLQNLVERGRDWGIQGPFGDYLNQVGDKEQIYGMLDWVINKCLITSEEDFSINSYKKYYQALLDNTYAKDVLLKYFKDETKKSNLLENFEDKYFLFFGAFDLLEDSLKTKCNDFLKEHISLEINPYFLKKCYSEEAKEKIIEVIEKKDYRRISSAEWPFVGYLRVLHELGRLDVNDLQHICPLANKFASIYDGGLLTNDFYECWMKPYYELVQELYESDNQEIKKVVEDSIRIYKPIYEEKTGCVLNLRWLSTENKQEFRDSFINLFSYSKVMKKEDDVIPCIGLALSRILLDDKSENVSEYEAVLEVFINYCSDGFWLNLLKENSTIKYCIIQIMEKFKDEIPLCYDDLFIKKQMESMAEIAKRIGILE